MAHARNPSTVVLVMPVTMHFLAGCLVCDGKDRTVAFRLRRAVSTSLCAFIAFSSSANCRLKSGANYPAHFPFAYVQEGCGPADGSALLFYFTVKPAKCGKYEEPFLLIQIIGNLPKSAPHAYAMGSGSRDILASRCQSPGHCEAATSGALHLTKFTQSKNASGEYELHFRDGSIEKGNFDATWCVVRIICR
jgi:hypothetical protein